jgi:hypothetical protein
MKYPYGAGFYQITARPPAPDPKAAPAVSTSGGKIVGLKIAGRRTPKGYIIELLVPWGAFPGLSASPGAQLALQFSLDDGDARDPKLTEPVTLTYRGARNLARSASGLSKWSLVEKPQTGAQVALGPLAALDFPAVFVGDAPVAISAEVGKVMSAQVGSMRIVITDTEAKRCLDRTVNAAPLPAPWDESVAGHLILPTGTLTDGFYSVTATINDQAGQPLGTVSRPFLLVRKTFRQSMSRVQGANVARMSQVNPFKAAGYLGVAVCIERLKRSIEIGDTTMAALAAREAPNRLDLLEKGKLGSGNVGLLDLLALSANPEAQVVVEFPSATTACVSFYCGGIPFVSANVRKYGTEMEATKALEALVSRPLWTPLEKTTVAGRPARVSSRAYVTEFCRLNELAPATQVLLVTTTRKKEAFIREIEHLSQIRADAAVLLPDCPASVRNAVETWAKAADRPIMSLMDADKKDSFVIAGDVARAEVASALKGLSVSALLPADGASETTVAAGDRMISVLCSSRGATERVIRLIAASKPISASEVDDLRIELTNAARARHLMDSASSLPAGMNLFTGDLHMHTFYTDGTLSPVGLALQSMYCELDYAVNTDHNTIEGAQLARALLTKHGFSYPLIVGEEITMKWSHMNAFPLKERARWDLSPEETIAAAHKQGAFIQWNHPDFVSSEWVLDHVRTPLTGTGLDAWEHYPPRYREWKRAGTLPAITGTSDTHGITLGGMERTIVLAPAPEGDDVAEAIRGKRVVALLPSGAELFYGSDPMTSLVWNALAEGKRLKTDRTERLKKMLKKSDLPRLLRDAPSRPIKPDALAVR